MDGDKGSGVAGGPGGLLGRGPVGQGVCFFLFFDFVLFPFFLFILSYFTLVTFYFSFCKIYT